MKQLLLLLILAVLFVGCKRPTNVTDPVQDPITDTVTLVDTTEVVVEDTIPKVVTPVDTIDFGKEIKKIEKPKKKVYKNWVRIALHENVSSIAIFAYEKYRIRDGKKKITISPGALTVTLKGDVTTVSAHNKSAPIMLPCTLSVLSGNAVWDVEDKGYRGEIILLPHKNQIMVLNHLPVEAYLKGVLPLEIGVRSEKELEALKAQAVAARTYTYAKMLQRQDWQYDLLPTVSDQVYGGTNVEAPLTDRAVDETTDEVMSYKGALVEAFYHSTCGGKTAAIHEVWNTSPRPYLVSRMDTKENGQPWCAISKYATWQEQWGRTEFETIVKKYSKSTKGVAPLEGVIQSVAVQERTPSGRVKRCFIKTSNGNWNYGKDKIRFIFRRPNSANSILRSSNFRISANSSVVNAMGRGFGHGIGMCQMGAIARARAGQGYRRILASYYLHVSFVPIGKLHTFVKQ